MSGYDWQQAGQRRSEERDRNAAVRAETVAAAPQRLGSALDRIADALVALTHAREQAEVAPTQTVPEAPVELPVRIADHATLARVEERLDSAIAMLRGVLAADTQSDEDGPAEHHHAPHDDHHGHDHHGEHAPGDGG